VNAYNGKSEAKFNTNLRNGLQMEAPFLLSPIVERIPTSHHNRFSCNNMPVYLLTQADFELGPPVTPVAQRSCS